MGLTERLAARLLDSDVPLTRRHLSQALSRMLPEEAPLAPAEITTQVIDALVGLGPIEALLRDSAVSDVLVNRPNEIWVERNGRLERTNVAFASSEAMVAAVERVIAPLGLRLDRASPAVDARLADGSRLHAVVPPVAVEGPVMAVRRFTEAVPDLEALVAAGALRSEGADLLRQAVRGRKNVVVSGGTGSGKTTLLNLLSKEIPPDERVVTVEDAAELRLSGHVVRLEARPANIEGAGEVSLRQLLRHALRLRPDRIIVGEVRGSEALEMIAAMNTGHAGSMSTVHANTPQEALLRLETLALSGESRVGEEAVRRQLWSAIQVMVQVERSGGVRRVVLITGVDGEVFYQA